MVGSDKKPPVAIVAQGFFGPFTRTSFCCVIEACTTMAALQYADGAKISGLGPVQAQVVLVRVLPTKDQGGRGELHKRILRMNGLRPLFTDFTGAPRRSSR